MIEEIRTSRNFDNTFQLYVSLLVLNRSVISDPTVRPQSKHTPQWEKDKSQAGARQSVNAPQLAAVTI